ncbi:hypothetical protein GCM10011571_10800 [Marinithermofilum abyssi]|uniref:Heptaprenyl diphosphate synthase n=1 Tax=Marinithermofilum abyssi TaxID=1571185 RepID=A0A8J2YAD3_9BACL|nr:heptaprenyl diphosphate synthase component 1 [Marinithermofilum abyssi]GGE11295.1 hypothetical protein GCM10011571_10800 [Marinithermofilum abyssi]
MTSMSKDLQKILAEIADQSRYSYMEKHIRRPEIPVFFVRVLYWMLRSHALPGERIHRYCVTAALVKMGLDIHDQVSTKKESGRAGMRSRQLTVLAGDYFSSLFYRGLADTGEVDAIQWLSEGICDINKAKMDLYLMQQEGVPLSPSVGIQLIRRIHAGLVTALCRRLPGAEENSWERLAGHLVTLYYAQRGDHHRWLTVPEGWLQPLAMEAVQIAKQMRPLDECGEVNGLIMETAAGMDETLVREG